MNEDEIIINDDISILTKDVKLYKKGFNILPYTTNIPHNFIIDIISASNIFLTKENFVDLSGDITISNSGSITEETVDNKLLELKEQLSDIYININNLQTISSNIQNSIIDITDQRYLTKTEANIRFNSENISGETILIQNKIDAYSINFQDADFYKLKFERKSLLSPAQISLLVSNIPLGKTLIVRIDNSNANKILFGANIIITQTETEIYNIIFGNPAGTIVMLGNKIIEIE